MLAWAHAGGFSLDASLRIEAHDRAGLDRRAALVPPPRVHRHRYHDARDGVDLTPSFDPAEPAPIPDFDMDQTRAG